ncbi:alpha/beta hydrolase [Aquitalea palustris]|uniref:Alpha/beta hydrolase n=1 Tax=Aquitalea palustris TaxID=2480983 RepID=A0A454JG95_9NEIS|nr:alpha/beta hydrolase [Aquitalea palustris]RMC95315.1 alpha/beta hydrolase [Aquitalea palustris]
MQDSAPWDKVFPPDEQVSHRKLQFHNRYGIRVVGDLYQPKALAAGQTLPGLVLAGPFGAVKEQSSGLYAQTLAARGFVTLAFDSSFTGESGGEVRNVASPDIHSEDFSAAVDCLGLLPQVDRERIGAMAICGLSGMALTAASSDARIKAVATASMYDMSRSISRGYRDSYTPAQRHAIVDVLSRQRWIDAAHGSPALGLHEIPFDAQGQMIQSERLLPETLPADVHPVLAAFFDYYRTPRGFHPRSINSTTAWTATTPLAFFAFPMAAQVAMISPRPVLLIAGANAHSRYYSEDLYQQAEQPKQLLIVPDAGHVDLYDRRDKIPFDQIAAFFKTHLA